MILKSLMEGTSVPFAQIENKYFSTSYISLLSDVDQFNWRSRTNLLCLMALRPSVATPLSRFGLALCEYNRT